MKIVTGKTGKNHVTSADDRALNQAIFGSSCVVQSNPDGEGIVLSCTLVDANTLRIKEGDILLQGCHARIEHGDYEDVTIDSGTVGVNRKDLVVARYTNDDGIEDVTLEVIKGTPTTGTATTPNYNKGSIYENDTIVDMPLWEITLTGINVEKPVQKFVVMEPLMNMAKRKELGDGLEAIHEVIQQVEGVVSKKADMEEVEGFRSNLIESINKLTDRVEKLEAK